MTSLYPRDPGDPHDEEAVDAVLMVGPDGRIQSASPGAETLFGRTAGGRPPVAGRSLRSVGRPLIMGPGGGPCAKKITADIEFSPAAARGAVLH